MSNGPDPWPCKAGPGQVGRAVRFAWLLLVFRANAGLAQGAQDTVVTLAGHTSALQSAAFSPNGTLLACGRSDKSVRHWRVADWALL